MEDFQLQLRVDELQRRCEALETEVRALREQPPPRRSTEDAESIAALERGMRELRGRVDAMPALPQTKLLSGSFMTRAFAVLGHYLVASLVIMLPLYLLIFAIVFMWIMMIGQM
ncbi:MAG TPA: hypothetical protein PK916_01790 [Bacteroidota bacterium]|nr:hypothetical protein [Bacteroidota bacterium]